ncbi:hypothetical protein GALMADRAFT_161220 [Galerina marginata CBS 339.88]|uniref:BTB domain-containing protein n=1 Tax=Galerina marginata (strain CBS 339.88) TaxID=685588 RepID=A0A067SB42_GALM3|nr:hypothetical protein GALMADRAFT_161220 [Galerina marginata CBS 339.88]
MYSDYQVQTDRIDSHIALPAQEAIWLESISDRAKKLWQEDLESLYFRAKHFFSDIVWHTKRELGDDLEVPREIWGHKAIVLARGSPAFISACLTRKLERRPNSRGDWTFLPKDFCDYTATSHAVLQLYTAASDKIEDENGFDIPIHPKRIDALRKDLLYMRKRRIFSDVHITLTTEDRQFYTFASHRFLLSSRSPYFRRVLGRPSRKSPNSSNEPSIIQLTLPSKHFTPAALYFILGYLYTGTLKFSHHRYDSITTALAIFSGSLYLELPALQELVLAEITAELLHGMCHVLLPNHEYLRLVDGNWTTAVNLGCKCGICARHAPRVLQSALDGINNDLLERGARRVLVVLFGEGWCTEEFSALPAGIIGLVLTDLRGITTASSALPMLFAAESALIRLENLRKDWGSIVKSSILSVREVIDSVLCTNAGICFKSQTWRELMNSSKKNLGENAFEQVTWVLRAVFRGANPANVSALYQALVSSAHSRFLPFSIWAQIERAHVDLREMVLSAASSYSSIQRLKLAETDSLLSSGTSYYSCVSTRSKITSLPEEQANITGYNLYISALDLATVSLYSLASSRTVSTDYGMYYTRWAISQEIDQDWKPTRTIMRRRSCDSVRN